MLSFKVLFLGGKKMKIKFTLNDFKTLEAKLEEGKRATVKK